MLLLLHGALGDHTQFDALRSALDERETSVIDFHGHGRAARGSTPLRMHHMAEQVVEHLDRERIERADIFGYSMGGYVALLLAARYPSRVGKVMTLATRLAWSSEIAARECMQLDPVTIREKVPRFAAQLEARHVASGWEPLLADTADMLRALGDAPLLGPEEFRAIQCPVRLCVGDRDTTATVEDTRDVQRLIPDAELEVLPRTPHPLERVSIARLAFSLRQFLE
jgi:pimeloyl-ACP methyl ester carboxylesterase